MSPRYRLPLMGLFLVLGAGVAFGQRIEHSTPLVEKDPAPPFVPKEVKPAPAPPPEPVPARPAQENTSVLSDFLTVFIFVALVAAVIIALVLAAGLFFRLRAAEDPLLAALDDAWVQGRLRELEAAPAEPAVEAEGEAEVPLDQVEVH